MGTRCDTHPTLVLVHPKAPLAHLDRWKENTIGLNIWDKSVILLGTVLGNTVGTCEEPLGNLVESIGNNMKEKDLTPL
jgi:hypothetical protein